MDELAPEAVELTPWAMDASLLALAPAPNAIEAVPLALANVP